MKNIYEILKSYGIEIPEDKKEAFDKEVLENYKTVKEVDSLRNKLEAAEGDKKAIEVKYNTDIAQRDTDLATLQEKLGLKRVTSVGKMQELTLISYQIYRQILIIYSRLITLLKQIMRSS